MTMFSIRPRLVLALQSVGRRTKSSTTPPTGTAAVRRRADKVAPIAGASKRLSSANIAAARIVPQEQQHQRIYPVVIPFQEEMTPPLFDENKPRVCVTGGSGFLASWIVKKLLEKGYKVHATTRRREKAQFLERMDLDLPDEESRAIAKENLVIFDGCDFAIENSFDDAIRDCQAVIHCASPFFNAGGTRENLVQPAVEGTEMVLNACKQYGVERVTLTSSSAAVIVDYGTKAAAHASGNHIYTDEDYSPVDLLEQNKNWYCLSKLLAEQRAWELSREPDCPYKLCVLNPSLIWGPMVPGQTHLNTSSQAIMEYMDGSHKEIQNGARCVVDVRDVADAHIIPIDQDVGWNKRYLLFGGAPHFRETARYVKSALQEMAENGVAADLVDKVPTQVAQQFLPTIMGPPADRPMLYDVSPAENELGIKFRSVEEMVTTCVKELLSNGFTASDQYDPSKL